MKYNVNITSIYNDIANRFIHFDRDFIISCGKIFNTTKNEILEQNRKNCTGHD